VELKIPRDLKEACGLIYQGQSGIRTIDAGEFNKRHFILRLGLGFEAEMVRGAERQTKNRFGLLAYLFSSASALKKITEADYHLKIDGKEHEARGITCIIANCGNTGFTDLSLDNHINMSDGLLDVIVVRKVNISLFAHIVTTVLHKQRPDNVELVQHWQGKDIHVFSTPAQIAQCDGEVLKKIPIHAQVIPAAFRVIVPQTIGPNMSQVRHA
jgi:diacylglycerol kinase family enzyme